MATKLHVTQQEIDRAYRLHKQFYEAAKPTSPALSRSLILCYAVECGLKQRLMRNYNLLDTAQMEQSAIGLHHDLRRYLKEAKLPAAAVLTAGKAKHSPACRPNQQVQPHQYHEAFRYGVQLDDDAHLIVQLERILEAC